MAAPKAAASVRPPKPVAVKKPEMEPNVRKFMDVLNEPLSDDEAKSLGMPAYGSLAIGLYKIFRHFQK